MSTKDDCTIILDDGLLSHQMTQEDVDAVGAIADSLAEVIRTSPWPDLNPEAYFIWMYSVEPFAEC